MAVATFALLGASDTELLVACLVATLVVPILTRGLIQGRFDFFYPPTLLSFLILIGYLLPLRSFMRGEDILTTAWPYLYRNFDRALNLALGLTILGAWSFFLGFAAATRLRSRPFRGAWAFVPGRLLLVGVVYTLLGLAMFAMGVVLVGGPAALVAGLADRIRAFAGLNYFFMAVFLPLDVALMWWAYVLATRRLFNPWFWLYAVSALVLSTLTGTRANTFVVVLSAVILYHLMYKTISFRRVLVLLAIGVVALVALQLFIHEFLIIGQLASVGTNSSLSQLWSRLAWSLSSDFYQIQALTLVVDAVPNAIPYQHGSTYVPLLLAPIPSSIWAGKLDFLLSPGVLTHALWPQSWLQTGTTLPPSLMGEMYMNFGAPGVGIGMVLFGALYGRAYASVKRNRENPFVTIPYAAIVAVMVHYIRGEFSAPTILFLFLALPVVAAAPLVATRKAKGQAPWAGSRSHGPADAAG